ncbi:MAG: phosphonoacetaldehyde hydrolase [Desulfatitalea sp.]|nr:phosphonoacetaldehyde hydrolase [Desulfatitalea sp.]
MQATTNHLETIGPVKAVVLDWAGTAVDYGCMGPAAVFVDVFQRFGIRVTVAEARQFMGLEKKAHVRSLCGLPTVVGQWRETYGHEPSEADVEALYRETEPMMVAAIARHADPIPGLLPFVDAMRQRRIRIGSCTGYTAPMVKVLVPTAESRGYRPDAVVCASDVPAGRPEPWMCYLNAMQLRTYPLAAMVKIGDTLSDIEEGRNAGMWTIGLTQSGNMLGLPEAQVRALDPDDLNQRLVAIGWRFQAAGAHYVARGIWECAPLIDAISRRMEMGEHPDGTQARRR